jgi:hypothetical protein
MVKDVHHLTIRDFSLFEKTGEMKYLLKGYVPAGKLYLKQIEKLLGEIAKGLGSEQDEDKQLQKEFHRLKSIYRIEYLITLYQAAYNLLINKTRVDLWREMVGKGKPSNYTNLISYVEKIKEATGIDIDPENWDDDMVRLKNEIDLWTDKYNQNFIQIDKGEGLTFFQIVMGVFAALNFTIDEDLCMSDFFAMKQEAEKISKRLTDKENG